MRRAAVTGDRFEARRLLHKLKGSAGAMHIEALIELIESFDQIDADALCAYVSDNASLLDESVVSAAAAVRRFILENTSRLRA